MLISKILFYTIIYKLQTWVKLRMCINDYRYETSGSISNSGLKFEIMEGLDLPDSTVCYIDGISIPHTWYTIETYSNQLYVEATNNSITNATIIILPDGNYTASGLAITMALLLQTGFPEICFSYNYNNNVGTIKITSSSDSRFRILTNGTVVSLQGSDWSGDGGHRVYSPGINNLRSSNEVFRNSVQSPSEMFFRKWFYRFA